MTKPFLASLARRFATMAALLAGIAMLGGVGASWWLINQEHAASVRSLLKKDAELHAASVSSSLDEIAGRMSELANSPLVVSAVSDSAGRESYLVPFLKGIRRINDVPVAILFTDVEGREISHNGSDSFSEQELSWLREKLRAGQPAARVQLGEKGEELLAVEFVLLSRSNSPEGAFLYRIKLDELTPQKGARLVRGKESEQLLHSPTAIAAAVNVPPIYKHFNFAVVTSPDPTARPVDWQSLGVFFILTVGMAVTVIILGLHFGRMLTKDLAGLEFFARGVSEKGFGTGRAEAADSLEVASLAQSINGMLDRLKQQHDGLHESEERFRKQSQYLSEVVWAADIGTWEWNTQTGETVFNKRWAEIVGHTLDELAPIGIHTWSKLFHPDDGKRSSELLTQCLNRESEAYICEVRMRHKNGKWVWVLDRGRVVAWTEDGKPLRMAGTHQDITERKLAQDEILRLNASLEERVQQRTEELHSQQEELRQSNEELEEKNKLLADQKVKVEYKNREIEASKLTLEERAEQLALTSKYKSEFLSSMSHELRTPLNSVLILAQILAENAEHNLSEQQIEYAKTIQGAGKDLLALISDILDLSKIESGAVTLELQEVSFANVREQVERTFRHVAESRGLGFGVELAPGLPPTLYTDSQRLQQVMKNLLSNAFKFTEKGQVSVRIALVESGWSVDHAWLNRAQAVIGFFVTDSGIGMPTTKQKIIFEAFQQADTGTARKYGGTGLGLSISREIAGLLGGELRLVESAPGKGSTFVLYYPLRAPESVQELWVSGPQNFPNPQPPAALDDRAAIKPVERRQRVERRQMVDRRQMVERRMLPEKPYLSANSLAGKKVLVVDDDVRNIFALTALLERHKMAALCAENGRAALEELGKNPDVDIVLMDIMMPEMDGFETMRQIRQMKQFASLPMIALTAKAMKGDREKCIEAGASDYLSKPVDTDQLLSLLHVWLYREG